MIFFQKSMQISVNEVLYSTIIRIGFFTITLSVLDIRKHVERIMVVQVRQEPHEVR